MACNLNISLRGSICEDVLSSIDGNYLYKVLSKMIHDNPEAYCAYTENGNNLVVFKVVDSISGKVQPT